MLIGKKTRTGCRRLGAFFLSMLCVATALLMFVVPDTVLAEIRQPEIRVPSLDEVKCQSYCVYDKTADEIILEKDPDKRIFPASQTKIMTCQLALDYLNLDDYLTVSANAMSTITADSSVMGISTGERVQVSELLYGLMLPSGNDAANVLAEGVIDAMYQNYPSSGEAVGPDGVNFSYLEEQLNMNAQTILDSYKLTAFVALMNLRAGNLGCSGTHFMNPSGLHDEQHYTTAHDLTTMIGNAIEREDFKILISTTTHIFKATNLHSHDAWSYVKNSNNILFDPWLATLTAEGNPSHMVNFVGGKTGTTSAAGKGMTLYTVNENGHELMISVCGIPEDAYYYNTMYIASVTAYGNLQCWENDPQTVIIGTTGDYRTFNAPESQQPQYDSLRFAGDELIDYTSEEEEPIITVIPTPTGVPTKVIDSRAPIIMFAKNNKVVSGIIAGLFILIITINIILLVRVNKLKSPPRRKKKNKK